MRAALFLLSPFILGVAFQNVGAQTYEASMTTVPFFNGPYNTANPPACNVTFLDEFSSGVWDWIHGLIEFAIRNNDFQLDGFTMSDAPYTRYLELVASAKDDEERRILATVAANTCKTCKYLGCYVWCSPRFCNLCSNDDDNRRRLRSSSSSTEQQRKLQDNSTAVDYTELGTKISGIVTTEAREYLLAYPPAQYACMGVASGLQIVVTFIPYS